MYVNKTYQRIGSLREDHYKSTRVDSEYYFLTVSRYIELNPVGAIMVKHPAEYPWSSYHSNALYRDIKVVVTKSLGQASQNEKRYIKAFLNSIFQTSP